MGQFLDEQLNKDPERIKYEQYLEEAKRRINPDIIPDDDGMAYWDFRCLFSDCKNHEFSRYWRVGKEMSDVSTRGRDEDEELRLAAECEVICGILAHKPRFCFS